MARKGWRGDPPEDDAEARARIIDAAMRCIDQHGPTKTSLSDVATELGVTRQTVYRHFPSTEDLLVEVAKAATDPYLDKVAAHVAPLDDPIEKLVEGIAFTIERLPKERQLGIVLASGNTELFMKSVRSDAAIEFGHLLLARQGNDLEALGFTPDEIDGLVEFTLRIVQSLVIDPVVPERSPEELRAFLHRWVAPACVPMAARG